MNLRFAREWQVKDAPRAKMLVVQASLAGNRIDQLLQYETIGQRAGRTIGTEQAIRLTLLRDGQKTDVGVRLQAENQ